MSGLVAHDGLGPLEHHGDRFDHLVDATPDIDRFCSSTDWIVPAESNFGDGAAVLTAMGAEAGADDDAAAAFAAVAGREGTVLRSLDPMWGYACPLVGPAPDALADLLAALLADLRAGTGAVRGDVPWAACFVTGLPPGGELFAALVAQLRRRYDLGLGREVARRVAHLDGTVESYLDRRSATFRRNARRAQRAAATAGVEFEFHRGGGADHVRRAIAIERRSWKGRRRSGLADPTFARFYLQLAERLAPSGRLRVGFARQDGRDVGFILGAVRGDTYRGFQLAYDDDLAALSIGNLLQLAQMAELVGEGIVTYDLGQDIAYKASWSDEVFVTHTLVVLRR